MYPYGSCPCFSTPLVAQNGPLEEAQMLLKEFEANGDDLEELKEASRKARTALVTGSTLDIKVTAATIAMSTGYLHKSKASLSQSRTSWT